MVYHVFIVSGWPVIRSDRNLQTHKRHHYVGSFENTAEMCRVVDGLWMDTCHQAESRRRLDYSRVQPS